MGRSEDPWAQAGASRIGIGESLEGDQGSHQAAVSKTLWSFAPSPPFPPPRAQGLMRRNRTGAGSRSSRIRPAWPPARNAASEDERAGAVAPRRRPSPVWV